MLEPHFDGVADYIYDKVMAAEISPHVTPETVERLKQRQKQHWRALFETTFDRRYREGVERMRRFNANAAHELRTPLSHICGRVESVLQRPRRDEEYREALQQVLREAHELAAGVNAMLRL